MRVISGAGEFEITVEKVVAKEGSLVLVGTMGVWESETIIEPGDIVRLTRVSLSPRVLLFLMGLPWRLLRRGGKGGQTASGGR